MQEDCDNRTTIDEDFRASISSKKSNLTAKPTINQRLVEVNGSLVNNASHDRQVSWLELLFDLAIVTAANTIVTGFKADVSNQKWSAPFIYITKMASILSVWGCVDNYFNRYGRSESLFDCVFILLQAIAIFCTSATVDIYADTNDDHEQRRCLSGFAIGMAFSHFLQLIAQLRVANLLPDSRAFSLSLLLQMSVWTVLWLVVGVMPGKLYGTWILFTIAVLGDFFREYFWLGIKLCIPFEKLRMKYIFIPMNVELAMHRAGLIVVIAIGEVTAAVSGSALTSQAFSNIVLAVVLGFFFKFMYFDIFDCVGEDVEVLALNRGREPAMAYLKLHVIAVLAIVLCAYHLVPDDSSEDDFDNDDTIYNQLIFASSAITAMLSMYTMGLLHQKPELHIKSQKVPQIVRTAFLITMSLLLLIVAGSHAFSNNASFISISEVFLGMCMLVEYLSVWHYLDLAIIDKAVFELHVESKEVPMQVISPLRATAAGSRCSTSDNAGGKDTNSGEIDIENSTMVRIHEDSVTITDSSKQFHENADNVNQAEQRVASRELTLKDKAHLPLGSTQTANMETHTSSTFAPCKLLERRNTRRGSAIAFRSRVRTRVLSDADFLVMKGAQVEQLSEEAVAVDGDVAICKNEFV